MHSKDNNNFISIFINNTFSLKIIISIIEMWVFAIFFLLFKILITLKNTNLQNLI